MLLEKRSLWKFFRVKSWISRFINNLRRTEVKGLLTTEELINKQKFWTKRKLQRYKKDDMFKSDTENANLNENTKFIYECK